MAARKAKIRNPQAAPLVVGVGAVQALAAAGAAAEPTAGAAAS